MSIKSSEIEECTHRYLNGNIWKRGFYRNNNLEGEFRSWHINGQLCTHQFYLDGKLEGERKRWYRNGQLAEQEFYRNGKQDGKHKSWHPNGQLEKTELFQNGKLHGESKVFNNRGWLIDQIFFMNGKMEGVSKCWFYGLPEHWTYARTHVQEYYRNDICIAQEFCFGKRIVFSKLKKNFCRLRYSLNIFLISDLMR